MTNGRAAAALERATFAAATVPVSWSHGREEAATVPLLILTRNTVGDYNI